MTEEAAKDFTVLVEAVRRVHNECAAVVNRTVNTTLTVRNWLIGAYIRDYEQHGSDRAEYGMHLLERLSDSLHACLDRCYTGRYLGLCRQLFDVYPCHPRLKRPSSRTVGSWQPGNSHYGADPVPIFSVSGISPSRSAGLGSRSHLAIFQK